jgi:hypothetical protein
MNNSILVLMTMLIFSITMNGQTKYSTEQGRSKARLAVNQDAQFLPNPVFFQPSVFFCSATADVRANRKWWRNSEPVLPQPLTAYEYIPQKHSFGAYQYFILAERMDFSTFRSVLAFHDRLGLKAIEATPDASLIEDIRSGKYRPVRSNSYNCLRLYCADYPTNPQLGTNPLPPMIRL